ncbi:GDSL-type esterase/lipase family protein [Intrasporangium calvum]|uniref:GDSL-type esterase/lipase family protein n=1 Tax=Intrasporangium calvum TaxID=53358 RepID=A0ABT5GEX7_9MICO|nr:GDSL-type esterase/lipase family protein [Intrasporangium calvum]MDC5696787.1 GDSL-type esterase/lipase family protein [Intrasporangium calvum]
MTDSANGSDNGSDRQPYGVGPAYPSAHTRFDDAASAQRPFRGPAAESSAPEEPPAPAEDPAASSEPPREPYFAPSTDFTVAEGVRDVGMVFVGASTTAGYGDPKGLGWVGRVVARTQHPDVDLTAYNLGIRGSTSGDVVARWSAESQPRWKGRSERRLVLSFGTDDILSGMTMARSRLNLANVIDEATSAGIGVFVVGLTPSLDGELNRRIEALAEAQADVCSRRGVTYVDCFRPLASHDQWMADLAASPDRAHPGQAGYGLIAWLVLHNGWNDWLSLR